MQLRSVLGLAAGAVTICPTAQAVHAAHAGASLIVLYSPAPHAGHIRLLEAVPPTANVPGRHVIHAVHIAALFVVLNVPAAQAAQARFAVAEPAVVTRVPGAQTAQAAQVVLGFMSWSQVSPAHATGAAVPPAQNSPTLQGAQVGALVPVPGAVCRVPAGHEPAGRHIGALGVVEMVPAAQAVQARSTLAVPAVDTN